MANHYTAFNPEINYCVLCIEMMQVGTPVKLSRIISTVCKGFIWRFALEYCSKREPCSTLLVTWVQRRGSAAQTVQDILRWGLCRRPSTSPGIYQIRCTNHLFILSGKCLGSLANNKLENQSGQCTYVVRRVAGSGSSSWYGSSWSGFALEIWIRIQTCTVFEFLTKHKILSCKAAR